MSEKAASRKENIIQITEKMFRETGYNGTSMRDIAAEVGIEAPSIYSHFKGKEELLQIICFRMAERFIQAIEEVNDIYFNAEEKLRMALQAHINILTNDLNASHVFQHEWKHLKEPYLSEFRQLRNKYENGFRQIILDGENENLFAESDKQFAVLTILSSANWITDWYRSEGKLQPNEIADKIARFILSGLKKK